MLLCLESLELFNCYRFAVGLFGDGFTLLSLRYYNEFEFGCDSGIYKLRTPAERLFYLLG